MRRMLAQVPPVGAGFFVKIRRQTMVPRSNSAAANGRSERHSRAPPLTCYNQRFPMADIRPFQALRYNLQRVAAAQVVTQPYDKITPAMQEKYYAASPYNLVRIILGRRQESDNTVENVYTRAAECAREWRREGILQQDAAPSIYRYTQTFKAPSGM